MNQLEPYLTFDGTCAAALKAYEKILGAKITALMPYGESPDGKAAGPELAARVMHAVLQLGDRSLMAADDLSGRPHAGMKGFSLSLNYPTTAEARKIFDALADGGTVTLPLDKTFWADAFGMVTDRFGTPWMITGGHMQS